MMEKIPTQTGARDQLLSDLKTVIQDAEAWLRHSGHLTGEEFKAAKVKFERTLVKAKEDPWKAVGLGTAVGVVIGMLIARK